MSLGWCVSGSKVVQPWFGGPQLAVGRERYPIARAPAWAEGAYASLLRHASLGCAPRLHFLAHAGGRIGFASQGTIAVGLDDLEKLIAAAFRQNYLVHIRTRVVQPHAWDAGTVRRALLTTLLGHELGHAQRRQLGLPPGGVAEEEECDFLAGVLDEVVGNPAALGEVLMSLVGCERAVCSHPPAMRRVQAYRRGRAAVAQPLHSWTPFG